MAEMNVKNHIVVVILLTLLFGVLLVAGAATGVYIWAAKDLPNFRKLADYNPPLATTVYAADGRLLGLLYREKRFLVRLDEVPPHVSKAFLAAEDAGFYDHDGVDPVAIFRAMFKNIEQGGTVQGASTITQQIIKQLLLSSQKKFERKLKEAILAYRLEKRLSKNDILTIYLNQVFFGAGAYGVEAAARTFFARHTGDLTLAQAALLAGLPKAPTTYNPFNNPEQARHRQAYVLGQMRKLGWISQREHDQALDEALEFKSLPEPSWGLGAYYLEEVRRELIEGLSLDAMRKQGVDLPRYGEDAVYEGGLVVHTNLDLVHQAVAEKALRKGLEEYDKRRGFRGPIKRLDPKDWDAFLTEIERDRPELHPGAWNKALVVESTGQGLAVRIGLKEALLDQTRLTWAGSKRLVPGDVIWTSVIDPADLTKPDKTGRKPAAQPVEKSSKPQVVLEQKPKIQGALASIEPGTGAVIALVGGYDFAESWFNRAVQARRQPGSAFKPIVYSAVLDSGFTPASIVEDSPISFGNWSPHNYGGGYKGAMPIRQALAQSRNLPTVRLSARIGIKKVIERARALGLEGEFPAVLPICLGAQVLSPLNLTSAYTAFARGGTLVRPRFIDSVSLPWGEELFRSRLEPVEAVSPRNAAMMNSILKDVVQSGTAVRAKELGRPVAGKTGTTNDEKDAWFIGYSPYLVTGVYVGFDQLHPMGRGETGGRTALPIWLNYRRVVEEFYPVRDFAPYEDETPKTRLAQPPKAKAATVAQREESPPED